MAKFELCMKKNKLGAVFFQANYLTKAEPILLAAEKEATELGIPYTNVYMNLANMYAQKKNYQKACDYFLKVIAESVHNEENKNIKFDELHTEFLMSTHVNNKDAYVDSYTNLAFDI